MGFLKTKYRHHHVSLTAHATLLFGLQFFHNQDDLLIFPISSIFSL